MTRPETKEEETNPTGVSRIKETQPLDKRPEGSVLVINRDKQSVKEEAKEMESNRVKGTGGDEQENATAKKTVSSHKEANSDSEGDKEQQEEKAKEEDSRHKEHTSKETTEEGLLL